MDENKVLGCFGVIALLAIVIIVSTLLDGWAISVLWGWFVVPVLGAPRLTWATAMGLSCVISMFLSGIKRDDFKGDNQAVSSQKGVSQ